jgi:V/A-type H+-transporting ATPase subunit E
LRRETVLCPVEEVPRMEIQLKELIDKIKTEGVAEAEQKANEIDEEARRKASDVVDKAKKEAEGILAEARLEAEQMVNTGQATLKQAGRDLILGLRSSITELFEKVVAQETGKALSGAAFEKMLSGLIAAWRKEGVSDIQVLLSEGDFDKLQKGVLSTLAAEMKKGVEFKPVRDVQAGFRIGTQDGSVFYDFTDQGIAENLSAHLNTKLAALITEDAGGEK